MVNAATYTPKTPALPRAPGSEFIPLTSPSAGTALSGKEWPQNDELPLLFTPITIGGITFKNRIFLAPLCQYSTDPATQLATTWHTIHLGGFAVRGASYVTTEAATVMKNGGITPSDLGFWSDEHAEALQPAIKFIKSQGAVAGIQLNHAGRKASTLAPWLHASIVGENVPTSIATTGEAGGWVDVWGPSAAPIDEGSNTPIEMSLDDIAEFKQKWEEAVKRADKAGFDVVEIHSAHGYLLHQFLSPIANKRTDKYGGSLENRMRLPLEIIEITRKALSPAKVVFLRISASDWHVGGETNDDGHYISWGMEQSRIYVAEAVKRGVQLVDTSSGGVDPKQDIALAPGYQVPFAEILKQDAKKANSPVVISAVGLITNGTQAERILKDQQSDVVTLGREFLRNADLVFDWAQELNAAVSVPVQYQRAYTRMFKDRVVAK